MTDAVATQSRELFIRLHPRRPSRLLDLLPIASWDGVFSFALTASMLFVLQAGTIGALLISLITLAGAVMRGSVLVEISRRYWYLLIFPAFALFSALWSAVPLETLKHAGEFAVTIMAALLLAACRDHRSVLVGFFWAFALYVAMSLAVGDVVEVGTTGVSAISGLSESKNEQADMAATGFLISLSLFVMGLKSRRIAQCVIAALAGAIELYAASAALSAGALAGIAVGAAALALLLALCAAGRHLRALVAATVGIISASLALTFVALNGDMQGVLAAVFDKDATLTGRTYLWARARDLIAEHPWLGTGFAAFWQQGNLDAEGLWQFAHITSREGFNFHSTMYDALVGLGWIGGLIFALTIGIGLLTVTLDYIRRPTLAACFWLSMAAYLLVRMPIESIGLSEFYISTVLLFALMGSAFRISPLCLR